MSTHDNFGRPWLKLSEVKPGMTIEVDNGFDCMKGTLTVKEDDEGFYVPCNGPTGKHYLEGQLDDDDDEHCIGMYAVGGPST